MPAQRSGPQDPAPDDRRRDGTTGGSRPPIPVCPSCLAATWHVLDAAPSEGWWWAHSRGVGRHGEIRIADSRVRAAQTVCGRCGAVPPPDVAAAAAHHVWWRLRALLSRISRTIETGCDPGPSWAPPDDPIA